MEKVLVLNQVKIKKILERMAFEIYENNVEEDIIYIAGIYDKGYLLSKLLKEELEKISPLKAKLIKVSLEKQDPQQSEVTLDTDVNEVTNKSILLVDDVMNSGRTMAYSLKPFFQINIKKIQTAVMIDRTHKKFPIKADLTGYALATTLKDTIEVVFDENGKILGVYLV
jgi:pyrimidine operon attenuation protein/uracil phosphoribosyltransferase